MAERGQSEVYDILIVGGGMVGASLACMLGDAGWRVGMIEAVAFSDSDQPSYDERTTAIAWGSRRLFEEMELWPDLAAEAAPIERLHVSERGRFGVTRVSHADYGVPALGYVLPNRILGRALQTRLARLDNVDVLAPVRFTGLTREPDGVTVTIADEQQGERSLRARLLVGADGARSRVRTALGIAADIRDYEQTAVVTTAMPSRPHANTAYERFTPDGPLAVLPRGPETCAVVWTLPRDRAAALCDCEPSAFLAALQETFGYRLGEFAEVGERLSYPLYRVVTRTTTIARAVLVGNAGHNLHPAAAQGFNLALRDAAELRRCLGPAGGDPGDPETLEIWRQARAPDQRRVSDFTDRIVRVFSNRVPGLDPARSLSLLGLELLPGIKHDMARRSMGLAMREAAVRSTV